MPLNRSKYVLRYKQPANAFEEALPVGNGRLGAMIYGRPLRREDYFSERIPINEETIWYGGPANRINPDARAAFPRVQALMRENRIAEAEYLVDTAMTGMPRNGHPYQMLAELVLTARHDPTEVSDYQRELDLHTGMVRVAYQADSHPYTMEAFSSVPDNVVVVHLKSSDPKGLDFHAYLRRRPFDGSVIRDAPHTVGLIGQAGPDGVRYAVAVRAQTVGGTVSVSGQSVVIAGANEAILYIAACSTFRVDDPWQECRSVLDQAAETAADVLRARHVKEHARLFDRVTLSLGAPVAEPTDVRLQRVREGEQDPDLMALHFQYARYLLMASSRPGCLPLNLQGLWCDQMTPIWNCNYTINVNLQMDYWPAEVCNLSECHLPLMDFLERLVENGKRTAQEMYGCRGFVAHHTSDLWADTAPTGGVYASAIWAMGGAWLALHAWERYRFTRDEAFLRERAYPILREAALFFCDYLTENEHGEQVMIPSLSPENRYLLPDGTMGKMSRGAAMDSQVLRTLFDAAITAAERIGEDPDLAVIWRRLAAALPPVRVNDAGLIQEWNEDLPEADPGHRHLSHLFALFPGDGMASYEKAAAKTLAHKLSYETDRTGWSQSWMANLFARLQDGEGAWNCLDRILRKFTHPNLLNDCPPLNIDGNFGFASAVAEMLLQSHGNEIHLMPALPKAWPEGEVHGLRARGGVTVSMAWRDGQWTWVEWVADGAMEIRWRAGKGAVQSIDVPAEKPIRIEAP